MGIIATDDSRDLIGATLELADYLGEDPIATAINVGNSFYLAAERWRLEHPVTPTEIANYYRRGHEYLWNLVIANYGIPSQCALREEARATFAPGASVLDFGAGIGSTILALPECECTHADVGGEPMDFARWRYERAGTWRQTILLSDDYRELTQSGQRFDGIVCTEVIEHVPDPESVVRVLAGILKPGGKLLATVSFDDADGLFPMHLNLDRWTNERFVAEVFQRHGLRPTGGHVFVQESA